MTKLKKKDQNSLWKAKFCVWDIISSCVCVSNHKSDLKFENA